SRMLPARPNPMESARSSESRPPAPVSRTTRRTSGCACESRLATWEAATAERARAGDTSSTRWPRRVHGGAARPGGTRMARSFGDLGGGHSGADPGRGYEQHVVAAPGPLGWGVAGQVDDDEVEGLTGCGEEIVEHVRIEVDGVITAPGQQSQSIVAGQRIGQR